MILTRVYPLLLLAALAAWAVLLPSALARLRRALSPASAALLFALVLGAFAVRAAQAPAHRVFDDEFEHLDAARRIATEGIYGVTTAGGLGGWSVYAAPTWPAGHHAALAAWMKVAGTSAAAARAWSALLGALTVLLIYWAAREAFDDEPSALAAAALWAALPLAVRYSGAVDLTSSSLFWLAASLACLHARDKEPSNRFDVFTALTLAYAVQVRPENAALIAYAALVCARRSLLIPAVLSAAIPLSIALSNRASGVAGYSSVDVSPFVHFARHIIPDVSFLAAAPVSLCALLAAALASVRRPARALPLLALSALFLAVYASFYRGDFTKGAEDRYALTVLLPLAVASASALAFVARPAAVLFLGLGLVSPRPAEPVEHERARALLASAARELDANTVVLGFNASKLREAAKRPAASAYFALEDFDGFEKARLASGAAPGLALWKDWGFRSRRTDGEKLEALLSRRYEPRTLAKDGEDELVLFTPR